MKHKAVGIANEIAAQFKAGFFSESELNNLAAVISDGISKPSVDVDAIANDIADQFIMGFCDDRMVSDFAAIIKRNLEKVN